MPIRWLEVPALTELRRESRCGDLHRVKFQQWIARIELDTSRKRKVGTSYEPLPQTPRRCAMRSGFSDSPTERFFSSTFAYARSTRFLRCCSYSRWRQWNEHLLGSSVPSRSATECVSGPVRRGLESIRGPVWLFLIQELRSVHGMRFGRS